jgi:hypothetical protein
MAPTATITNEQVTAFIIKQKAQLDALYTDQNAEAVPMRHGYADALADLGNFDWSSVASHSPGSQR